MEAVVTRVPVNPELLRWAGERSGLGAPALRQRFPKLDPELILFGI